MQALVEYLMTLYGDPKIAEALADITCQEVERGVPHLITFLSRNDTALSAAEISKICTLTEGVVKKKAGG